MASKLIPYKHTATWLTIIFSVGIFGMLFFPKIFVPITPLQLLLCLGLFIYYDSNDYPKFWSWMLLVGIGGWSIEWLGTTTGFPFGDYRYGHGLGWKWKGVPFIIGVNWILLTYAFSNIVGNYLSPLPVLLKSALVATGMTLLDRLIEPVCDFRFMWYWSNNVPIQNYIAWFILSFLFAYAYFMLKLKTNNPLALLFIGLQILYFLSLHVGKYMFHLN